MCDTIMLENLLVLLIDLFKVEKIFHIDTYNWFYNFCHDFLLFLIEIVWYDNRRDLISNYKIGNV